MENKMIHSAAIGNMILSEDKNTYACETDWLGQRVNVSMPADESNLFELLEKLDDFFDDIEGWDSHLRKNAVEQLFEIAAEFDPSLKEEEFFRRIIPQEIQIFENGIVRVCFDDDGMLMGMRVTVYAEL